MKLFFSRRLFTLAVLAATLTAARGTASAQEPATSPAPPASPAPAASPTLIDMQYDGKTHVTLAPYLWAPSVGGSFQYTIPTLRFRRAPHGGVTQTSATIGPSDYLPKLNSAAMFFTDVRKGNLDVFGDVIYVNASMSGSTSTVISGPRGRIQIPVTLDTNAHLSTAIWEIAAGYTVAHGHNADLSLFTGLREFPTNLTFDYNFTIVGKRRILTPSGSATTSSYLSDLIVGMRGKLFFGDGHLFVPYYADYGNAINMTPNETWQAYGGAGYAFNHGQTLVALWRALNYNTFSPGSHVQRAALYGPLLGYTFQL